MAIAQSVGRGGANRRADVKFLQIVLNMNLVRLNAAPPGFDTAAAVAAGGGAAGAVGAGALAVAAGGPAVAFAPVAEDGACGAETIGRIEAFERVVGGVAQPTGRVAPGAPLLAALRAGVPADLTLAVLRAMAPDAGPVRAARYHPFLVAQMAASGIDTPLRRAHFLAQLAHESGDFVHSEEIASGAAYEGRADLGNTRPGDGRRFKGRGLIQITGRANYTAYGRHRGRDYVTGDNPRLLATDPETAVDCSCWYWRSRGINARADADDVVAVTRAINGGTNGLADRRERLARSRYLLGVT